MNVGYLAWDMCCQGLLGLVFKTFGFYGKILLSVSDFSKMEGKRMCMNSVTGGWGGVTMGSESYMECYKGERRSKLVKMLLGPK